MELGKKRRTFGRDGFFLLLLSIPNKVANGGVTRSSAIVGQAIKPAFGGRREAIPITVSNK